MATSKEAAPEGEAPLELRIMDALVRVPLDGLPRRAAKKCRRIWRRCETGPGGAASATGLIATGEVDPAAYEWAILGPSLQLLTQAVTRCGIELHSGRRLLFHAGAVAHPQTGATFVYVAPGGTGKTTLSAVLGREFAYVTDETVCITNDFGVVPYPKPLSRRQGRSHKEESAPDDLGLIEVGAAPWLAGIAVIKRTGGPLTVETLDFGEAAVRLAPESSALALLPQPLHLLEQLLTPVGGLLSIEYAEAADLLPLAREILARTERPSGRLAFDDTLAPTVEGVGKPAVADADADAVADALPDQPDVLVPAGADLRLTSWLTRAPKMDELTLGEEHLVLVLTDPTGRGRVVRLSALGAIFYDCVGEGVTVEDLGREMIELIGPPPDGRDPTELVLDAARDLVTNGVLVCG